MNDTIRILLVDPGCSRHEVNEPIGIETLAGFVRARHGGGVSVRQHFFSVSGPVEDDAFDSLDILGVSTPLGSLAAIHSLVERWRHLPRRPLLVLGGLLSTFAPDAILDEFPEAVVVLGEGEDALSEIVEAVRQFGINEIQRHLAAMDACNLVFRLEGTTIRTQRRLLNLGSAPPPDRVFASEVAAVGGIVRAEASRGCSWGKCTFCAIQHKYCGQVAWRTLTLPRILEELGQLSDLGARHPYYTDEDFSGNDPARAVDLAAAIIDEKAHGRIARDLTLYLDLRVASILDPGGPGRPSGREMLLALREAGLREVFVGVESGTKEQVRRYGKPATSNHNLHALRLLRDLGLEVDVGFIFFDPEMTLADAAANLGFIREARLWGHDSRLTKAVRVESGTPLLGIYEAKGLIAGPLQVDDLSYPYRWLDGGIETVFHAFRTWERKELERTYTLQAATRGEVPSASLRRARRALLGEIRAVELSALEMLVDAATEGRDPAKVGLDVFDDARARLLARWDAELRCAA